MRIMGIDAALRTTGWCIFDDDVLVDFGKIQTRDTQFRGDKREERNCYIIQEIESVIDEYNIDILLLERSIYAKYTKSDGQLHELNGMIKCLAFMKNIKFVRLFPSEVKRLVTGYGAAHKRVVSEYVQKQVPGAKRVGLFCDKNTLKKTSDIYDSIALVIAYKKLQENPNA